MAGTDKKKRSPIVFFLAAFFAIVIVMFIVNRETVLVEKVRFPFNSGVANLSTYENFLVAVCRDNKVWVWDWDNLWDKPRTCLAQSHQVALLKPNVVVSIRQRNPKAVVLTNLEGDERYGQILIASNNSIEYLTVSRDRTTVALLVAENAFDQTEPASYELSIVGPEICSVDPIITLTKKAAGSRVRDLAISDDGTFVVLFGEKNRCAWLLLVDLKQRRVMWEKELPEVRLFFDSAFSPDGKVIYLRGSDSTLYKIETASGKILNRLLPAKDNKSTLKSQHIQTVAVSPDGRFVAASVFGTIYAWDCTTSKRIFSQAAHTLVSGLAFSPDSRFLATSHLKQGKTINIWRVSDR